MPPLDPLLVNALSFQQSMLLFKVKGDVKDARLIGLRDLKIKDVKADPENLVLKITAVAPKARVETEYDVKG